MSQKGRFITLEGGEGTGKSTQAKLLSQSLRAAGIDVVTTREPGGTPQAERIRTLLLQRDSGTFDPVSEVLMMMAARREHLVNLIWPALERGQWVISDRFADSTRAFQGYGMGVSQDVIESVYRTIAGDFQPDATFIFDIDPEVGLGRSLKRLGETLNTTESTEDRYERMGVPFHTRLRQGFLDIAAHCGERSTIIDAAQDIERVHRDILSDLSRRFSISLLAQKGAVNG